MFHLTTCETLASLALIFMIAQYFRGLALGIALTVYGREEEADTLIEQMTRDQDPILRYGGMYALALAYRGTANNKAIRQLLHFAVSDVSDDVRRTAVLALGFVLYSDPEQVSSPFLFIFPCSGLPFCGCIGFLGYLVDIFNVVFIADSTNCFPPVRVLQSTCSIWSSSCCGYFLCGYRSQRGYLFIGAFDIGCC